jgi:drug/metabolite transporter (DMT)-like permease
MTFFVCKRGSIKLLPIPFSSRTAFLTAVAMLCFAANSLLCRIALVSHAIDPATFTTVRVASAGVALAAIMSARGMRYAKLAFLNWKSAAALLAYLLLFSFAYTRLNAGTGALLLFGAVQLTMLSVALWNGEALPALFWAALLVAVAGLFYLVLPGITAPDAMGALMMAGSGTAWGIFTMLARSFSYPIETTANNFFVCLPAVAIVNVASHADFNATTAGVCCAVISGALASGVGYVIWSVVLHRIARVHAATIQLTVPTLAALGGMIFLSEPLTPRLVISCILVLGGVAIALAQRVSS